MKTIDSTKPNLRISHEESSSPGGLTHEQELIVAGTEIPTDASGLDDQYEGHEKLIAHLAVDDLAVLAISGVQISNHLDIGPAPSSDFRSREEKVFTPRKVNTLFSDPDSTEGAVYYHHSEKTGSSHGEVLTAKTLDPEYTAAKAGLKRITTLLLIENLLQKRKYL